MYDVHIANVAVLFMKLDAQENMGVILMPLPGVDSPLPAWAGQHAGCHSAGDTAAAPSADELQSP